MIFVYNTFSSELFSVLKIMELCGVGSGLRCQEVVRLLQTLNTVLRGYLITSDLKTSSYHIRLPILSYDPLQNLQLILEPLAERSTLPIL